jgi:hypothetical protein
MIGCHELHGTADDWLAFYDSRKEPVTKLLLLTVLAFPLAAFDAKSEVAQLNETMDGALAAKDFATLSKCLTADYFASTRSGVIRDFKSTLEFYKTSTPPSDLKRQVLKTSVYGDTVVELVRETWTANGDKMESHVTNVYVKQSGSWKQASRSASTISAPK